MVSARGASSSTLNRPDDIDNDVRSCASCLASLLPLPGDAGTAAGAPDCPPDIKFFRMGIGVSEKKYYTRFRGLGLVVVAIKLVGMVVVVVMVVVV
jgi:hypothetical protein